MNDSSHPRSRPTLKRLPPNSMKSSVTAWATAHPAKSSNATAKAGEDSRARRAPYSQTVAGRPCRGLARPT